MQCSQLNHAAAAASAAARFSWRALQRVAGLGSLLLMLALPNAWAEKHALLIGVNEVQALPARLRLRGPSNDVGLMRRALIDLGVPAQNITVLAQNSPVAASLPTYAAVKRAMDGITQAARAGDTIVVHLAGHGVQVPQAATLHGGAAREPDGLDEVFLLQDSGLWDAESGGLPRTLRDDEIGAWIDTLVDGGARVFAIFDSCHAAGLAREPAPYARWRSVAGAELGIPTLSLPNAAPDRVPAFRPPPRTDGRVLAYAARGHELAGEEWLPKGGSLARTRVQGVFSFEVAGALASGARTAGELSAALGARYAAARRATPTPLVVGSGWILAP